ncbi:GNAT family N-acetyltransferase [Soonwooa sp.]|uniref:GNAT family N-acetyltransferase n=1 Tax=Soonwooa sp. TaxID=1938592 RepID=UPI002622B5DF|nr:GNAT family N-acetyltransferase [Soonwooa sp.]
MDFRKAKNEEVDEIWEILQFAIQSRKNDGSRQWQDGYPNRNSILEDIENGAAYILADDKGILAYGAAIFDVEPAYNDIQKGEWLTNGDYVVVHRVAAAERSKGMSIATKFFDAVENLAKSKNVFSVKVDTNFDNLAMLRIMDKLGYQYCGEVFVAGGVRKAFEKVLS